MLHAASVQAWTDLHHQVCHTTLYRACLPPLPGPRPPSGLSSRWGEGELGGARAVASQVAVAPPPLRSLGSSGGIACHPAPLTPLPPIGSADQALARPPLGCTCSRGLLSCQRHIIRRDGGSAIWSGAGRPGLWTDKANATVALCSGCLGIWPAREAGSPWPAWEDQAGLAR